MTSLTTGKGHWVLALSGILLVMGLLLGLQVNTRRVSRDLLVPRNPSEMGLMFKSYQDKNKELTSEIGRLRAENASLQRAATGGQGASAIINEKLEYDRMGLGLVPLRGPGVTLLLDDSNVPLAKDMGDDASLVLHDFDLIQAINELWADGAEAISLNGQRIVAGSAVVCSGRLMQVNGVNIPAPFAFTVIGDADALISGLNMRGGMLERLRGYGFKAKLTRQDHLLVPAIAIAPKFHYARPAPQEEVSQTTQEALQ